MKRGSADCKGPPALQPPPTPIPELPGWKEGSLAGVTAGAGGHGGHTTGPNRKEAPPWAASPATAPSHGNSVRELRGFLGASRKASWPGLRVTDKEYTCLLGRKEKHRRTHTHVCKLSQLLTTSHSQRQAGAEHLAYPPSLPPCLHVSLTVASFFLTRKK